MSTIVAKRNVSVLLIALCSACVEPITIPTNLKGGIVVIDGQISNIPERSVISISIASDSYRFPEPISGALVRIMANNEYLGTYEESEKAGKYLLSEVEVTSGIEYHIEVELPDGRNFKSTSERLPSNAGTVSTHYEIENDLYKTADGEPINRPFIKIFADCSFPESASSFIKWYVEEVFIIVPFAPPGAAVTPPSCFVYQSANPQSIYLLDARGLGTSSFNDKMIASRLIDYSFIHRHYFVTYQSSISQEAFKYWSKVSIMASQTGSIFDIPPGTITGNVYGDGNDTRVAGYFQVTNETFTRIHTDQWDFPFRLNFASCLFDSPIRQLPLPSRCFECINEPNSSFKRPEWF